MDIADLKSQVGYAVKLLTELAQVLQLKPEVASQRLAFGDVKAGSVVVRFWLVPGEPSIADLLDTLALAIGDPNSLLYTLDLLSAVDALASLPLKVDDPFEVQPDDTGEVAFTPKDNDGFMLKVGAIAVGLLLFCFVVIRSKLKKSKVGFDWDEANAGGGAGKMRLGADPIETVPNPTANMKTSKTADGAVMQVLDMASTEFEVEAIDHRNDKIMAGGSTQASIGGNDEDSFSF